MAGIIEQLGFSRLVHVFDNNNLIDDEIVVIKQAVDFGIDSIYFCTNENHSYPALFLKKINDFDDVSLKNIVEIQQKIWNFKKVLFLYVYTDTELRIYNCVKKPVVIKQQTNYRDELKDFEVITATVSDKEKLNTLSSLFSAIAIDTGIIWTLEDAFWAREKINIQTRVDNFLVTSLIRTAQNLVAEGLKLPLVHKLLLRSLFLLYLEDRGATDDKFYKKINNEANSYFSILENVEDTYKLFRKLDSHFNGSLFEVTVNEEIKIKKKHLQLIKKCFTCGDDGTSQQNLFPDWRIFNFKIIQIELLSEIYENFMAEIEPEKKQQTGTFYTPPTLVEFMLNEILPIEKTNKQYNVKTMDPTCGSGIFLVESFKRLIKRYENTSGKKLTNYDILKKLLMDNIFGMDINPNALKIAAFSLYLALLENLEPKTLWQKVRLPYLISDNDMPPNKQGKNLFCLDVIKKNNTIEAKNYDLIVGNPPFGTKELSLSISDYCNKHGFAKEQVLPFLHKATIFSPNGDIALIFNAKILTNNLESYSKFREWLFNSCYVEKIYNFSILRKAPKYFGGQLFSSSTSPICIIFYKKNTPKKPSKKIKYYAPKTFVKSNILDGIVIDDSDVSYLPREECQNPNTKIWKIAMWGGEGDIELIKKLTNKKIDTIKDFMKNKCIKSGVGFGLFTHYEKGKQHKSIELANMDYLDADSITRYYTSENVLKNVTASIKTENAISFYKAFYKVKDIAKIKKLDYFRREGTKDAYKAPHIIVKKGLENNKLCASFIDVDCSFKDGVYGFYSKDSEILKVLMSYFNSKLSTYFIFMTNSSYGIEREQIMKKEFYSIPINITDKEIKQISDIVSDFLKMQKEKYPFNNSEPPPEIINKIENIIYKSLALTDKEIAIINDTIDYTLDLFHNKEESSALRPVVDITFYTRMLCDEINDFLVDQESYINPTLYEINNNMPLVILKLSFGRKKIEYVKSNENIDVELQKINQYLWKQQGCNIYFRKKMNYYDGDDIYVIRPNQKRFWTQSAAINDATEIILECLNGT